MTDEMPTLDKMNVPDRSETQFNAIEKTAQDVNQRYNDVITRIQIPPEVKTLSFQEFNNILVDALRSYLDERGFFDTVDRKDTALKFISGFIDYLTSEKPIENPNIKQEITQAIEGMYNFKFGERIEIEEEQPEMKTVDVEGTDTGEKLPPLFSQEVAQDYLKKVNEIYSQLDRYIKDGDQDKQTQKVQELAQLGNEILVGYKSFQDKFRDQVTNYYESVAGTAKAAYDTPVKLVYLLTAMIGVVSSLDKSIQNYFYVATPNEEDRKRLKARQDTGLYKVVENLTEMAIKAGKNGETFQLDDIDPSSYLRSPIQEKEQEFMDKITSKKPLPEISSAKSEEGLTDKLRRYLGETA